MRFTDVTVEDLRPKELDKIHAREMKHWEGDLYTEYEAELDAYLSSEELHTTN